MNVGELFVRITADASGVDRGVASASRSLNGLTAPAAKATQGMNALKGALGTVATQALGVNPALGRVGVVLSSFALSGGTMAAALIGLAALAKAWELITSKSRAAKEEMTAALDRIKEIARVQALGPGGQTGLDLKMSQAAINAKKAEIAALERAEAAGGLSVRGVRDRLEARRNELSVLVADHLGAANQLREGLAKIQLDEIRDRVATADRIAGVQQAAMEKAVRLAQEESDRIGAIFDKMARAREFNLNSIASARPGQISNLPRGGALRLDPVTARGGSTPITAGAAEAASGLSAVFATLQASVMGAVAGLGPLAVAAMVLAPVMEGLMPVFEILKEPLRTLGQLIGLVITPLLERMAVPIRLAVKAYSFFVEAMGMAIRGIGQLIDKLPFISGGPIIRAGQEMIDGARAARAGLEEAGDAAKSLASGLSNMPEIFDIALRRRQAGLGSNAMMGVPGASSGGSSGGVVININNPPVRMDVAETARQLKRAIVDELNQGGTTQLTLAIRTAAAA